MDFKFERKKHIHFFNRTLHILPNRYSLLDTSRLTIVFFALSGLDVLGALDDIPEKKKQEIINWIYSLQVVPNKSKSSLSKCGFRGSNCNGVTTPQYAKTCEDHEYDSSHIAMTYTGLASLLILGDDLRFVNKKACLEGIKALQLPDGSFKSTLDGSESDMRFVYCACCVCAMLNDFSAVDQDQAVSFILKSLCYDGAFGQGPNQESHGGSTYCACASLKLLGRLNDLSTKQIQRIQRWCITQQNQGFHGRPHKDDDTCYSFWIGASLKILGILDLHDFERNEQFILSTQDIVIGGFGKWPQIHPDALHSYMGVCGLSLMGLHGLHPVCPDLNITLRAVTHLKEVHKKWNQQRIQRELAILSSKRVRTKSGTSIDRTHTGTVALAFIIGLGAVFIPWIVKSYFKTF